MASVSGASQGPHFIQPVQLKQMIKAHSSGRMVSSGISDDRFSTL